jgi:uncharacterized protein YjdB
MLFILALAAGIIAATSKASALQSAAVKTIEVSPRTAEAEVGQQLKLTAVGKDGSGKSVDMKPAAWFALPTDIASADESGTITFYNSGEAIVGVVIGGKTEVIKIKVKPAPIARIEVEPQGAPLVVGGATRLQATARTANGNPRLDVTMRWTSKDPGVASVDEAGLIIGVKSGQATLQVAAEKATCSITVEVIPDPIREPCLNPALRSKKRPFDGP